MSKRSLYTGNHCWNPNALEHSPAARSSATVYHMPVNSAPVNSGPVYPGSAYSIDQDNTFTAVDLMRVDTNNGLLNDRVRELEKKIRALQNKIHSENNASSASIKAELATMQRELRELYTMIDQKLSEFSEKLTENLTEKLTSEFARMELSLKESAVAEIRKQKSNVYERLEKRVSKIETEVAMLSAQHKSDQERLALWKAGADERIKKLEDLYNTTLADAKRVSAGCAKGLVKFGAVLDEQQKSNNLTRISFEQRMDRMDVNLKKLIDGMKEVRDIAIQSSLAQSAALLSLGD
jgi:predicted  nucleic acid-binding Zn-ribbon protein